MNNFYNGVLATLAVLFVAGIVITCSMDYAYTDVRRQCDRSGELHLWQMSGNSIFYCYREPKREH